MNKIEEYKKEKDGLAILHDLPRYAADGWETITDGTKSGSSGPASSFAARRPAAS